MTVPEQSVNLRLRRIEGQLAIIIRALDVDRDERDLEGEIAKAYRRGYLTGHHQRANAVPCNPDQALLARRRLRSTSS